MSKLPKPPESGEKEPEKPVRDEGREPEEARKPSRDAAGKYYYDDAYGYEDYKPEKDEDPG